MTVVAKEENEIVLHENVVNVTVYKNEFLILFQDDYLSLDLKDIISIY